MSLALMALLAAGLLRILSTITLAGRNVLQSAAEAPVLVIGAGAAAAFFARSLGAPGLPADWISAAAEAALAALVFVSAAQIRLDRFIRRCPASFRLAFGGGPLFLVVCALCAFILLPELSAPSALLLGGVLMLNGAAFDRRAVTAAPAPAAIKAAVRIESAAALAIGAPIAALIAGYATAPSAGQHGLEPLLDASLGALAGFALGGAAGLAAARRMIARDAGLSAVIAGAGAFLIAALIGANAVIAAGAAGLIWSQEGSPSPAARIRLRRRIEACVPPAAYFLFGLVLAPRIFEADLLSIIFVAAAVTVMRAGPRLAMLQSSRLPKESQVVLAWFGGAPGAASALFLLMLISEPMIHDHESLLTVGALAIVFGVVAARLTSRPLANAFLRQTAMARKRRMYAG